MLKRGALYQLLHSFFWECWKFTINNSSSKKSGLRRARWLSWHSGEIPFVQSSTQHTTLTTVLQVPQWDLVSEIQVHKRAVLPLQISPGCFQGIPHYPELLKTESHSVKCSPFHPVCLLFIYLLHTPEPCRPLSNTRSNRNVKALTNEI